MGTGSRFCDHGYAGQRLGWRRRAGLLMKLISWNVAGRVKKQLQQMEAVFKQAPDLLALQEVTSKTAVMWIAGLKEAGFEYVLSSFDISKEPEKMVGGRGIALLIASKFPIEPLAQEGLEMPWKERLLSALVHHPSLEFEFHNAYIPPGASHEWLKIDTFEGIYNYLAHETITPRILCGDFNSPKQELSDGRTLLWGQYLAEDGTIQTSDDDGWALGEKLVICDLAEYDLPDLYRQLNGWDAEDYSWLVYRKGKVVSRRRFDHVFASPGMQGVSCGYLHGFREEGLSDHSAVEAIFSPGNNHHKGINNEF